MKRVVVRVKSRYPLALVVAAIPPLLIGADLVLFPFGDPGQMQDNIPVGLEPSIRLGTALIVAGIVVLVAGLLGFVVAWKGSPAWLTPAPIQTLPDPEAPSPALSSEVEAAIVKLLDADEKLLYLRLRDSDGAVLQRDIVDWGTFSPAKVSRLLHRLETKGLVVRERHGMTNRVRLTRRPVVPAK